MAGQSDQNLMAEWGAALAEQGAGAPEEDLAADWGAALAEQGVGGDDVLNEWASMLEDGQGTKGGADRILNQDEIDGLLGFSIDELVNGSQSGIRAIIDSAMVSYERLPMLEILFDRFVRLLTTSLRNFTSDNVEVSIDRMTSVRFGDYLNSIPLPAIITVFKAEQWDNFGLITVDSNLIYSIIDVLLGGRRGTTAIRVEGRPYTTIELGLVKRMIELVLADGELAFGPVSPVDFTLDRMETNPRFARSLAPPTPPSSSASASTWKIAAARWRCCSLTRRSSRSASISSRASWARSSGAIRSGRASRDRDLAGPDRCRRGALRIRHSAPLDPRPQGRRHSADRGEARWARQVRCGDIVLSEGRMGRVGDRVAVRLARPLKKSRTTMAIFEMADALRKES